MTLFQNCPYTEANHIIDTKKTLIVDVRRVAEVEATGLIERCY
jgi:hypothetical protein